MQKQERHLMITNQLNEKKTIKVTDIAEETGVSTMTIRRDLEELEEENLLIRVHGGAKKVDHFNNVSFLELSHREKRTINIEEKKEIAQKIARNIHDNETVFLGSGSTLELVYNYLDLNYAKIITNSIHVFNKFKHDPHYDLILTGGIYRSKTGSFTGIITNELISNIHVQKAFVGVNAINNTKLFNYHEEEGLLQKNILRNSSQSYIVADHNKFDQKDFYQYCDLSEADYLITDSQLAEDVKEKYSQWIDIIN